MNLSNHVKALMAPLDSRETEVRVRKDENYVVQKFDYTLRRSRDEQNQIVGGTVSPILSFTISVASLEASKVFYDRLLSLEPFAFTFFFNANFGPDDRLFTCDDEFIARGYVINIDESYHSTALQSDKEEQLMLDIRVQLTSVTYRGRSNDVCLAIANTVDAIPS